MCVPVCQPSRGWCSTFSQQNFRSLAKAIETILDSTVSRARANWNKTKTAHAWIDTIWSCGKNTIFFAVATAAPVATVVVVAAAGSAHSCFLHRFFFGVFSFRSNLLKSLFPVNFKWGCCVCKLIRVVTVFGRKIFSIYRNDLVLPRNDVPNSLLERAWTSFIKRRFKLVIV